MGPFVCSLFGEIREADAHVLVQKTLGEGLALTADSSHFCIFRDHVKGLEYIRNSRELCDQGLYAELDAFKFQVLIDFKEVQDNPWNQYSRLAATLNGRGVPHLEETWKEMLLQPLHQAFRSLFNPDLLNRVMEARVINPGGPPNRELLDEIEQKSVYFLSEAKRLSQGTEEVNTIAQGMRKKLESALQLPILDVRFPWTLKGENKEVPEFFQSHPNDTLRLWGMVLGCIVVHPIGRLTVKKGSANQSRAWIEEWRLDRIFVDGFMEIGADEPSARRSVTLIKLLTRHQEWFKTKPAEWNSAHQVLDGLLKDEDVLGFLQVNRHNEDALV